MFELLAWIVLLCLLLRVLSKLTDIYALLRPEAPAPPSLLMMPQLMVRKGMLTLYGAFFLVMSKDAISKKQMARAPDADDIAGRVDREVRVIFIRHGESMWNLVFNRGVGPSSARHARVWLALSHRPLRRPTCSCVRRSITCGAQTWAA